MAFFNSAIDILKTPVIALGAGLGVWGVINLLEGYFIDTAPPGALTYRPCLLTRCWLAGSSN